MIDWMAEVLFTFKTCDQTFFLAVNLLDRYFKHSKRALVSTELHLLGIACMFIASKYEDVIPILMRTAVNKIAHNKFSQAQIEAKEIEVLQVLGFRIGQPSVKEFIDQFLAQLTLGGVGPSDALFSSDNFRQLCYYLAKSACHNYSLMQLPNSILATSIFRVAVKIYETNEQVPDVKSVMRRMLLIAGVKDEVEYKKACKLVLDFTKTFEKNCPGFKNIRTQYAEVLEKVG